MRMEIKEELFYEEVISGDISVSVYGDGECRVDGRHAFNVFDIHDEIIKKLRNSIV